MLLNFQKRFALSVWEGEKRQTIRSAGQRVDVPAPGDVAHCYTGLRTSNAHLLGRFPISVVRVLRMTIDGNGLSDVLMGGDRVNAAEFEMLAQADGFKDGAEMQDWFERNHPPGEFYGWVVRWEWSAFDRAARGPLAVELAA